jgi:hypothetical protein
MARRQSTAADEYNACCRSHDAPTNDDANHDANANRTNGLWLFADAISNDNGSRYAIRNHAIWSNATRSNAIRGNAIWNDADDAFSLLAISLK